MPTKRATGPRGAADAAWRDLIHARDVSCQAWGWPGWHTIGFPAHDCGQLQCCHVVTRGRAAIRTDLDNGILLCASAHVTFTNRHEAWLEFVDWWAHRTGRIAVATETGEWQGDEDRWYRLMERRADELTRSPRRMDWTKRAADLRRLKEMQRGM